MNASLRDSYMLYDGDDIYNASIENHIFGAGLIGNGIISGWLSDEITPKSTITQRLNGAIIKYLQYVIVDKVRYL